MNVILNKNVDETKLKTIKTKQEKGGGGVISDLKSSLFISPSTVNLTCIIKI